MDTRNNIHFSSLLVYHLSIYFLLLAITTAQQFSTPVPTVFHHTNAPISPTDPRATAFAQAAELLKPMLNVTADPCNNFYEYTCGAMQGGKSFARLRDKNYEIMAEKMDDPNYRNSQVPKPVRQLFAYYDTCKEALQNWDSITAGATYLRSKLQAFQTATGLSFPLLNQNQPDPQMPNKVQMGKILGYLEAVLRTPTLITSYVDTNWRNPHSPQAYILQIDQSSLVYSLSYYMKTWASIEASYRSGIIAWMNQLQPGLDQNKLAQDVDAMIQLELTIAYDLMIDDTTRRKYARSYNVYTTTEASMTFDLIDWTEYLNQLATYADAEVKNMMKSANFQFNVLEPAMLTKVSQYIKTGKIQARTLINYFNYRIVDTYGAYMPSQGRSEEERKSPVDMDVGRRGPKPRNIIRDVPISKAVTSYATRCAGRTIDALPYINARVYLDAKYPTEAARQQIRQDFANMMDTVLIGFRSMIDQLSWMSTYSKKGAYGKIDDLAKNVAYPDFVVNDTALTEYYAALDINEQDSYTQLDEKLYIFNIRTSYAMMKKDGTQRDDFLMGPGLVNAWYQPSLNSITFPVGILQQPFYDPKWPVSLNYGSMGVIVGHEVIHGFDDQGVQWDGTGMLYQWMDPKSYNSFEEMAYCVITEYGRFCPLPETYQPQCLDGYNTQGENIADNGGIQAAYRAYKNYQNLHGPDPLLNDPIMRQFTHDQLFFMGFAQVWCQAPPSYDSLHQQILTDPHSPSLYRVFGTVQNFPAFRTAFNCPLNTNYAPQQHCDVWVNPIKGSYGVPDTSKADDVLNVPKLPQVQPDDSEKYNAYMGAVKFFEESMNISADPCNSFYEYTCGNYKKGLSFRYGDEMNFYRLGTQMELPKYANPSTPPSAVDKTVAFYKKCKETRENFPQYISDGKILTQTMESFKTETGLQFSMISAQNAQQPQQLDSAKLGKAVGLLSSQGVHTLLTPMVDTNWLTAKTFTLFIDQNTLYYAKTYYTVEAWPTTVKTYKSDTIDLFNQYATLLKVQLDQNKLSSDVDKLLDLEVQLAQKYSTSDSIRRQYGRSWNPTSVTDATNKYRFINFEEYFAALAKNYPELGTFFKTTTFTFSSMEPEKLTQLSNDFATLDSNVVANYLFYRLLAANKDYLPKPTNYRARTAEPERNGFGRWPRAAGRTFELNAAAKYQDVQTQCSYEAVYAMQYSTGRIFIDSHYPNSAAIQRINSSANAIMYNILKSFQGMLDRLDWMDETTKKTAYTKITDTAVNVVAPDFIFDDNKLNEYYKQISFNTGDGYIEMKKTLDLFTFIDTYRVLMNNYPVDRHQFHLPPAVINAWYQPEANSITFPAAILRQPFYDENWPASLNYGAFGLVAGHELTHGFDDQGVQWDGIGALKDWMSNSSAIGFRKMADCVVNEYNQFCPLSGSGLKPECVNGDMTQGENIADNGGIHASWRAYKDHVAMNGPDPLLPDPLLGQLTHDQLFFMSFAAVWCEIPRSTEALYTQIMTDPHSPSNFRIFGTIQNFPAFREAFNCPVDSAYAPKKHCSVWVPEPGAQP
ncbi:Neprilysin-2 [Toxocara canis]|uniref:Neprilysin-2 n=1 Tax=Toxocara canis TaxID=6265 RepID=A0A0B2VJ90_TOXCA|nr:Neprilysin-2 [Toxocara canis]